jgi:hypothetical protein
MLNWMAAVKALMLLLSASAVLVPVVHGLAVYGWNIRAMVIPTYSPPKIDFRIEPSGLRFDRDSSIQSSSSPTWGRLRWCLKD